MREELDALREIVKKLRTDFKSEKAQRQTLEANKLKYIMMTELLDCKGQIQGGTFFDNKRN